MADRVRQVMVESLGLLTGGGIIIGATFTEALVPEITTAAVTQVFVETLSPAKGGVAVTQALVEVLEGSDNPLLLPEGSLPFDFPASLSPESGRVLATGDHQRHTRVVYERLGGARRAYKLSIKNATGAEVELVRKAVLASRGGAIPVSLVVPVDDAGPVRYRVLNAGINGDFVVGRQAGGSLAGITLEIEEV